MSRNAGAGFPAKRLERVVALQPRAEREIVPRMGGVPGAPERVALRPRAERKIVGLLREVAG